MRKLLAIVVMSGLVGCATARPPDGEKVPREKFFQNWGPGAYR